jgi:hypothetical protein
MKSRVPKNDTTPHAYGVDDECLAAAPKSGSRCRQLQSVATW